MIWSFIRHSTCIIYVHTLTGRTQGSGLGEGAFFEKQLTNSTQQNGFQKPPREEETICRQMSMLTRSIW